MKCDPAQWVLSNGLMTRTGTEPTHGGPSCPGSRHPTFNSPAGDKHAAAIPDDAKNINFRYVPSWAPLSRSTPRLSYS